ncbi:sigma factor [Streptomyces sp. NPDC048558]|uniref:sigma factor n=1 Tax=Streptomyces sp. NPDC048558 TaxID=3155759 RepID=UPI00342B45A5
MYGKARQLLDQALIPQSLADSDDIVSAAFTAALRRAHELENPRAYVYQVMRNEARQLQRRRSSREALAAARVIDPWHWDNPPVLPDSETLRCRHHREPHSRPHLIRSLPR